MKNIGFENILYPYTDERVFPIVMQNPDVCRKFLEKLFPGKKVNDLHLRDEIPDITRATAEKTLFPNVKGHGVRFDVLFEDEDSWYDIEMQVRTRHDLPKRTRYYHSLMDSAFLKRGQKYSQLNPQYVIFICAFDPFKKGNALYKFSMRDEKTGLPLCDESFTIILNTTASKKKIPETLQPLFLYVNQGAVDDKDELVRDIHDQVLELNSDSDWRDALMTWEEMLDEKLEEVFEKGKEAGVQEGIQEGIKQGMQEGRNKILAELIKANKLDYESAISLTDDPEGLDDLLDYRFSRFYTEPDIPF